MMTTSLRSLLAAALWLAFAALAQTPVTLPAIGNDGPYLPGKFVWFDLVTDDLAATRAFYGAVFGWQFETIGDPPQSYTVIRNAQQNMAGAFLHPRATGTAGGARWLPLISVDDPARAVQYTEQQGGKVLVPPTDRPRRGTHALLRDPEGAVFGILRSATGDPPDTPVDDGDFFWLDLLAQDPAREAEFYRNLAGYSVTSEHVGTGVDRLVLSSGRYARAAVAQMSARVKKPGWLPYVLVNDVPGTLQKVTQAGGRVLVEPRPELLDGNLAVIADPRGGVLGIIDWDREASQGGTR